MVHVGRNLSNVWEDFVWHPTRFYQQYEYRTHDMRACFALLMGGLCAGHRASALAFSPCIGL